MLQLEWKLTKNLAPQVDIYNLYSDAPYVVDTIGDGVQYKNPDKN